MYTWWPLMHVTAKENVFVSRAWMILGLEIEVVKRTGQSSTGTDSRTQNQTGKANGSMFNWSNWEELDEDSKCKYQTTSRPRFHMQTELLGFIIYSSFTGFYGFLPHMHTVFVVSQIWFQIVSYFTSWIGWSGPGLKTQDKLEQLIIFPRMFHMLHSEKVATQ